MPGSAVYIGSWMNHSYDRWILTLEPKEGGFLISALVIWVSLCALQFWNIVKILLYFAVSATQSSQLDRFLYQLRALLRNSGGGTTTAYRLIQLSWSWRKKPLVERVRRISYSLIVSLLVAAGWFAAAFFISYIYSKTGNDVLLARSPHCGYLPAVESLTKVFKVQSQLTNNAAEYVRQCYDLNSNAMPSLCNNYPTKRIPIHSEDAKCPFNGDFCVKTNSTPYRLDTGLIDTSIVLGIEAEKRDRVQYRRVEICSPVSGFYVTKKTINLSKEPSAPGVLQYLFHIGPIPNVSPSTFQVWDSSHLFPFPYSLEAKYFLPGSDADPVWFPNKTFFDRTDADAMIFFLTPNNVFYNAPVYDPMFLAGIFKDNVFTRPGLPPIYTPSGLAYILSCTEQHQFCNPNINNRQKACTPLVGQNRIAQSISDTPSTAFNDRQIATILRIRFVLLYTMLYNSVAGREGSSLLVSETLEGSEQLSALPKDQWRAEVTNWFAISLAKLQASIVAFAAGPTNPSLYDIIIPPAGAARDECTQQRVRRNGYLNFDIEAIIITAVVGTAIIVLGMTLAPVLTWYHARHGDSGTWRQWKADEIYELQKKALDANGFKDATI